MNHRYIDEEALLYLYILDKFLEQVARLENKETQE